MRAALSVDGQVVLQERDVPEPDPGEVLVRVAAAGVNRADLLQAAGHYDPPSGATDVLGLEASGTRVDTGEPVTALLAGGGCAEFVAVPEGQLMSVPVGVSLIEAAGLPEVACTVHSNLVMAAGLTEGETVLIHGGSGGIGSFAIQYAKALGAHVVTTVGSEEKAARAKALGADVVINHRTEDFAELVRADVILDVIGAKYLTRNVAALTDGGRLVIIGLQGGTRAELDLSALMAKRGSIIGTRLRSRSTEQKTAICASTVEHVWPLIAAGRITPQVETTFPLADIAQAHELMRSGEHTGKIVLLC